MNNRISLSALVYLVQKVTAERVTHTCTPTCAYTDTITHTPSRHTNTHTERSPGGQRWHRGCGCVYASNGPQARALIHSRHRCVFVCVFVCVCGCVCVCARAIMHAPCRTLSLTYFILSSPSPSSSLSSYPPCSQFDSLSLV